MISLVEVLIAGALMGTLYALIASGFALILGVARLINLAHGELVVLGAYLAYGLWGSFNVSPILTMPLAALLTMPLAFSLKGLLPRIRKPFELHALVLTFAFSLLLQNLMQALFTANYRVIAIPAFDETIALGPLKVSRGRLLAGLFSLLLFFSLSTFLHRTFLGKAMRAFSLDREAAALVGINPQRIERLTLLLGGALAGLSGPLFALLHAITPTAGVEATIIALILTILGGIGRPLGLLVGGLLFGLVEALVVFLIGASWKEAFSFLLLLLLLQRRSFGLGGKREGHPPMRENAHGVPSAGKPTKRIRRAEILLLGLLLSPLLLRPDDYTLYALTLALLFAALALSWTLLASPGLFSFGHAAFFGLGAYASAILSLKGGLSPLITLLLGTGLSLLLAVPMGVTCLHLRGPSFSLATLAWAEILKALAFNWTSLTEGAWGLIGIPPLPAIPLGRWTLDLSSNRGAVYAFFVLLLVVLYTLARKLSGSWLGLALRAIHQGEERAEVLGVATFRIKLLILAFSGGIAGFGGGLYAHLLQALEPGTAFSLSFSFLPLVMALVGGRQHPLGPVVGALVLSLGNELLLQPTFPWLHQIPYALALLFALLFLPRGLVGGGP